VTEAQDAVEEAKDEAETAVENVEDAVEEAKDEVEAAVEEAVTEAQDAVEEAKDEVEAAVEEAAADTAESFAGKAQDLVKEDRADLEKTVIDILGKLPEPAAEDAAEDAEPSVESIISSILSYYDQDAEKFMQEVSDLEDTVKNGDISAEEAEILYQEKSVEFNSYKDYYSFILEILQYTDEEDVASNYSEHGVVKPEMIVAEELPNK